MTSGARWGVPSVLVPVTAAGADVPAGKEPARLESKRPNVTKM